MSNEHISTFNSLNEVIMSLLVQLQVESKTVSSEMCVLKVLSVIRKEVKNVLLTM